MDIDKVYIPLLPQGHKVKFKVTKVIAVFLPILLGFHLLGVLDCLPLVADTISLDMLVWVKGHSPKRRETVKIYLLLQFLI